jgi:hypothetical protein
MMRSHRNGLISAALAGAGVAVLSLAALPAMAESAVVVRDFVLSRAIDNREPVGATDFFRVEDGKAVAFARIHNSGAPTSVSFVWHHGATTHAHVPMHVGTSPGWRTWSSVTLRAGNWRVALVDAYGEVLLEKSFAVGPGSSVPMAAGPEGMQDVRDDLGGPVDPILDPAETPASVVYPMR